MVHGLVLNGTKWYMVLNGIKWYVKRYPNPTYIVKHNNFLMNMTQHVFYYDLIVNVNCQTNNSLYQYHDYDYDYDCQYHIYIALYITLRYLSITHIKHCNLIPNSNFQMFDLP